MDAASLLQTVLQNQVVTGLSFTALLGGAVYQLRNIPTLIHRGALRFLTVELTVLSSDPAFEWLDRWLAQQPYAKKSKMMRLNTVEQADRDNYSQPQSVEWTLAPGPGTHLLWWRKRPLVLTRSMISKDGDSQARVSKPLEQLHFRTLGHSQATVRALVDEARHLSNESQRVPIRIWSDYTWSSVIGKSQRDLSTIILKHQHIDRLISDIQWFLDSPDWYAARGIPYRRGYLFSGPPGTGKTSIVLGLASYFNRPICVLNLSTIQDDTELFSALRVASLNAIILIEDIDCAFSAASRVADDKETDGRISKAGLLNALDGITTPDGRIFIMTTNYPDRLDPALLRPGRADVCETFYYFGAEEQRRMGARFYDHFEPLPFSLSPAEMQAAFMRFPHDAKAANDYLYAKFYDPATMDTRPLVLVETISGRTGDLCI